MSNNTRSMWIFLVFIVYYGGPGGIRTPDRPVISRALYQAELRAPLLIIRVVVAGRGFEPRSRGPEPRILGR